MKVETINLVCNAILVAMIGFLSSHGALVARLIFYWFFLDTVVTCILLITLLSLSFLLFHSQSFWLFSIPIKIKIPHFLDVQEGIDFQRWVWFL